MSIGMQVEVQGVKGHPDAATLKLSGQIDARSLMSLQSRVEELAKRGTKRYLFDLEGLKYVNSTGLAYLINLAESQGEGRKAVLLYGMQPKVKIIFDTMGVSSFFGILPSLDAALKELAAPPPPAQKKTIRRGESSTKTGRVSPPTSAGDKGGKGFWIVRFFRKLFGRSTAP